MWFRFRRRKLRSLRLQGFTENGDSGQTATHHPARISQKLFSLKFPEFPLLSLHMPRIQNASIIPKSLKRLVHCDQPAINSSLSGQLNFSHPMPVAMEWIPARANMQGAKDKIQVRG
ncbi:hypothetical protein [Pseudomonas silesiensis]|uniref:hypothetical protein n=2 Tax=Pseudomonas TaxID=286 RepID=UPI0034D44613